VETLLQDLRYALRLLRRSPAFTAMALLIIALGVGANSLVFSVANGWLWRPLPVREPAELVTLFAHSRSDNSYYDFSWPDYQDFRKLGVFTDAVAYTPTPLNFALRDRSERIWGELVSGNYFDVLGVPAALGRTFLSTEGVTPGDAPVAVISDAFWARFDRDPGIVNRTVKINGQAFTIVGVAPPSFRGVYQFAFAPDVWVAGTMLDVVQPGTTGRLMLRGATSFRMMARLKPGITHEQAAAAVKALGQQLEQQYPTTNAGFDAFALRHRDAWPEPDVAAGSHLTALLFLGGVGLVLLVACGNVANLLLARAVARRREIALRVALGADRSRVVRQLLTESAVLATGGAVLGLLLTIWGTDLIAGIRLPTDIPFSFDFGVDGRVVAFTVAAALATGIIFGLAPALRASRPDLVGALKGDGGARRRRMPVRHLLVIGQVAVSCLVLVAAGLTVRTLSRMANVRPGFTVERGLLASVSPGTQGYKRAASQRLYRDLQIRVAQLPGVQAVSTAQFVPLEFSGAGGVVYIDGRAPRPDGGGEVASWAVTGPDYLATIGTPLLEGREFRWTDDSLATLVAIVNRTMAERFWPGQRAIGRTLRLNSPTAPAVAVIGVAENGKYRGLTEPPRPFLYLPQLQNPTGSTTLVVRAAGGDPLALEPAVRSTLAALDPTMPLFDVKTMDQLVRGRALLSSRLAALFSTAFAALALVLAAVGLYGLVSFAVAQRTRDIGIRMALGATRGRVLSGVLRDGMTLAGLGIAAGLAGALVLTRVLGSLLFEVSPRDPVTLLLVTGLLAAITLVASWLPARRATRIEPMSALRTE
jgi:predicted permease